MPFRPTHRQLAYLVALEETGHFGAAAKRCNVSQPTLSAQVKLLEEQLGTELVDRGAARATLTPTGARVASLARRALATLDEITALSQSAGKNLGGLVRLGSAPTFGPYFMPWLLPRIHAAWPGLALYIREERPRELEASVLEGAIDCAIGPEPQRARRLVFIPLVEETLWLGLPRNHRLAEKQTIVLDDLAGEAMLTLGPGHRLNEVLVALCDASGAIRSQDYEGTSLDAVRQMVSIGMGLSVFPEFYVTSEFRRETGAVLRQIEAYPMRRAIGIYWREASVRDAHFRLIANQCAAAVETARAARA